MAEGPEWRSWESLEDHFRRHGAEVGARDEADYLRLARETVRLGREFTYRRTGSLRFGYYHARTKRFVAINPATREFLSLSRRSENYVRTLRDSTYRK